MGKILWFFVATTFGVGIEKKIGTRVGVDGIKEIEALNVGHLERCENK